MRPWPTWMYEVEGGLEPAVRMAIWEAEEAGVPQDVCGVASSSGCGAGQAEAPIQFVLNEAHPAAPIWQGLRAQDEHYESQALGVGLQRFAVSTSLLPDQGPLAERLALLDDETVSLVTHWWAPPPYVGFRLVEEGDLKESRRNVVEPTWTRTWVELSPDQRAEGERLLTVQLEYEDEILVERAFWQRPRPH